MNISDRNPPHSGKEHLQERVTMGETLSARPSTRHPHVFKDGGQWRGCPWVDSHPWWKEGGQLRGRRLMGAEQLGRWRQHFPQEGNPVWDGGLGEQRSGLTEDLQLLGTIIPPGGGGGSYPGDSWMQSAITKAKTPNTIRMSQQNARFWAGFHLIFHKTLWQLVI